MKIKEGSVMDIEKEREAFEKHASKFFTDSKEAFKTNGDQYLYDEVIWMWDCWIERAKAQAVPEWKDYELEKPNDGQKCLVIFESKDCEDAQRWMCIDEFNEGMFDFIANWEDQCASVALPAGSIISKVRAVCWTTTNLSNAPLSFDQFYEAQEPAND